MSTIDEVKSRIDIVDLVSQTVQLRRSGKSYLGFCPFHSNTRTPAFVIFPESGTWRCFGQCNEGGDIFSFVMKKEGWDFSEALHFLADKAGVELKPPTAQEQAAAEEHENLRQILEDAVIFFRHQLLNTPQGQAARQYLLGRGLRDETLEAFGLGYAPHSWEALTSHFTGKGAAPRELLEAGLVSERESGGVYDRFRHRVMFPIRDERGRMAGFGARILNPEDMPKFLNSPQTALFDKGRLLYGLDRARRAIRAADQAVIVEGYLDVIALHQAGYENAVSPMGTALTEHHLRLLKRFSQRIVLALDPDAAGDQATLRGLEIARQAMDREVELSFDAHGLLAQEARLQADIRVTTLPEGMDPDEVVNRDAAEWQRLVEEARPVVIHVMETLARGKNLDDPKIKSEIAAQVLPLIADVPSPIERDTYRQRLARLLRVSEDSLFAATRSTRAGRSGSRPRPAVSTPRQAEKRPTGSLPGLLTSSTYAVEAHALGVLMRRPDLLYRVNRNLHEHGLSGLSTDDFQHVDHQAIIRLLSQSVDQDNAEPLNYVLNGLSLPMMEIADSLLAHTERLDPSDDRVLADVLRAVLDLRQRAVRQSMEYLRYLMEDAQEQGDLKATQYRQTMVQHTLIMQRLNKAMGQYTSRVIRAS